MAKSNPGGSADYTLRSIDGGSVTLSDIIRNNPRVAWVELEVTHEEYQFRPILVQALVFPEQVTLLWLFYRIA